MRLTAKFGSSLLSYHILSTSAKYYKLSSSFVEYADVFGNHYSTGVSVTRNLVLKLYMEVRIIKIIVIILMIVIIIISSYDFLSVNDKNMLRDCVNLQRGFHMACADSRQKYPIAWKIQ